MTNETGKTWSSIIRREARQEPLFPHVEWLMHEADATWPAVQAGRHSLDGLMRKELRHENQRIIVQSNPMRLRSLNASLDKAALAARPCFLCPDNFPAEELGVSWEDLAILPNPFPALPMHLTIARRAHEPQLIAPRTSQMLRVAERLGPQMAVTYNGPGSGASAPDHFHFQACAAESLPLLVDIKADTIRLGTSAMESFGRRLLIVHGKSAQSVVQQLDRAIASLGQIAPAEPESLLNVVVHHDGSLFHVLLFPRNKHRPACFYKEGDDRILVSPGVLEMAGILITPDPTHWNRVDASVALNIYDEVSLDQLRFQSWCDLLEVAS